MAKFLQQRFLDWFTKYDLTRLPEFFASFRSRWWRMICWFGRSRITVWTMINISSCSIHMTPPFKWWTFYSENSDSCVRCCGEKRKKSYTTATSYRRATWPRFRRNKLICAYIYIYLNGGVRVSDLYERGSQLIAPPTNVIEASLARMEISLGYIASSIDLLTHRTLRRVTPSYIYIHTHIVSRKMHAMREIFLRYLKIVRVLQGRSLGIRFTGFLFEVFRLKKKWIVGSEYGNFFFYTQRKEDLVAGWDKTLFTELYRYL